MNKGPKISIITACYNAEKTIEQTIQSVLSQTYDNIEYIIVDGASTDGTMDIVNKYREQIDIVISEPDKGIYDAFNKGISISSGDIIYFLNADDEFYNNDVLIQIKSEFENDVNLLVVYGDVECIDSVNKNNSLYNLHIDVSKMKEGWMPHHQGTFYGKSIFEKYGLYSLNYRLASDYEFTTRYFEESYSCILHVNFIIAKFRDGGASQSLLFNQKTWQQEMKEIVNDVFDNEVIENPLKQNYSLFKLWLELSLKGISIIGDISIKDRVALFGSGDVCLYLLEEFNQKTMQPLVILDNSAYKQCKVLKQVEIHKPKNIVNYDINKIILTVEANCELEIKEQLKEILGERYKCISILTWKELVSATYNELLNNGIAKRVQGENNE